MKKVIETSKAPAPIGPYSQAIMAGNTLYMSGSIALDFNTNEIIPGGVKAEAEQVMKNIEAILKEANMDFNQVVKTTIYLKNMADFPIVNEIYGKYFTDKFPARETVSVVALPKNATVEISVIAVI